MVRGSPGALRLLSGASVLARGGGPLLRVRAAERWRSASRERGARPGALTRSLMLLLYRLTPPHISRISSVGGPPSALADPCSMPTNQAAPDPLARVARHRAAPTRSRQPAARSASRARARRPRPRGPRSPGGRAPARPLPEVVSRQLDRRPVRRAPRRVPPRLGIGAERPQVRDALLRHEPFERREPVAVVRLAGVG